MDETPVRLYGDIREAMAHEDAVEADYGAYTINVSAIEEWELITEDTALNKDKPSYLLTIGFSAMPAHVFRTFETMDELEEHIARGYVLGFPHYTWRSVFED